MNLLIFPLSFLKQIHCKCLKLCYFALHFSTGTSCSINESMSPHAFIVPDLMMLHPQMKKKMSSILGS